MKRTLIRRNSRLLIVLILACASPFVRSSGAFAATFTVSNTNDSGSGSLRQAVLDSNTAAGSDTIVFDAGVFGTPQTITLASTITINPATGDSLTIIGPGAGLLTVSGNNAVRIFTVSSGDTAAMSGMTLTQADDGAIDSAGSLTVTNITFHDNLNGNGGAIANSGASLTVIGCTFTENECNSGSATGLGGGAIYSSTSGTVAISNSTFTNNHETGGSGGGGAIRNRTGTMNITDSTFSGNTCVDSVGGGAIVNSATMTTTGCSVTGNFSPTDKGGVANGGVLTMTNCVVSGNTANDDGGGIGSSGTLNITGSTIANNTANADNDTDGMGGGLSVSGNLTISNSTISGNMALGNATSAGNGGGIDSAGITNLTNVTVTGNTAGRDGGGIRATGVSTMVMTIDSCTIVNNTAARDGGGVVRGSTSNPVNFHATIVADNSDDGTAPDILGSVVSQGYNLIENTMGATFTGDTSTNITGLDPNLGSLADNGGATETHALLASSPALDTADPDDFPATDQRGIDRPRDGDGNGSLLPDIGAYERAPGSLQFSSADYSVAENVAGGSVTITVTRLDGLDTEVTVDYATSDGTAVAGQDYQPAGGTLVFPAQVSSQTFDVQIIDDAIPESDETVNLTLSNPSGGGSLGIPAMATLTIVDNDTMSGSLTLTGAVSRKTHGSSGDFDLPLILDPPGSGTVEPRKNGPTTLVFTFSDNVVASDGTLDGNEFAIMNASFASASSTGNQITLNLTNVIDQSVVSVALNGIESAGGTALSGDNDVEIRALVADANQDRIVDRSDLQMLRDHANETVNETNFLSDLDLSGMIDSADGRIVRQNKLHTVP